MLSQEQKTTIRALRSKGRTYSEICAEIGQEVHKSTLSYICKDVVLPESYDANMRVRNLSHIEAIQPLALAKNKKILENRLASIETSANQVVNSTRPKDI